MEMSKHNEAKRIFFTFVILCGVASAGCASNRPKPTLAQKNIRSVVVFPPQTSVWLQKVGQREPFPAEAQAAQAELFNLVCDEIQQRGLILKSPRLDERDADDPAQQSPFFSWARTMWTAYNEIQVQQKAVFIPMASNQTDEPLMKLLAKHTQADALIMTQAAGWRSSGGATTINEIGNTLAVLAALGGAAYGRLHSSQAAGVRVYLVDGNSGQILWTEAATEKDLEKSQLEKMVKKIFKNFPP
jgi:hypothetical protein